MDHPNIARVLDAGATETGRPFFVMELARGSRTNRPVKRGRMRFERWRNAAGATGTPPGRRWRGPLRWPTRCPCISPNPNAQWPERLMAVTLVREAKTVVNRTVAWSLAPTKTRCAASGP